jgi:hypothetical protein
VLTKAEARRSKKQVQRPKIGSLKKKNAEKTALERELFRSLINFNIEIKWKIHSRLLFIDL